MARSKSTACAPASCTRAPAPSSTGSIPPRRGIPEGPGVARFVAVLDLSPLLPSLWGICSVRADAAGARRRGWRRAAVPRGAPVLVSAAWRGWSWIKGLGRSVWGWGVERGVEKASGEAQLGFACKWLVSSACSVLARCDPTKPCRNFPRPPRNNSSPASALAPLRFGHLGATGGCALRFPTHARL